MHRENFVVKSYDLDATGKLSVGGLCRFMQEAASTHAVLLGVGGAALFARGLAWAMHRLKVEIDRRPKQGDTVAIETWPSAIERLSAHRDFLLLDEDGAVLARATSAWIVFDLATRRAGRVLDSLGDIPPAERPRAAIIETRRPPAIERADVERKFRVRRSDLDVNAHANNTAYADWAIEATPETLWRTHRPALIELLFRAECTFDEEIVATSTALEATRYATAIKRGDLELARAETRWIPLSADETPWPSPAAPEAAS